MPALLRGRALREGEGAGESGRHAGQGLDRARGDSRAGAGAQTTAGPWKSNLGAQAAERVIGVPACPEWGVSAASATRTRKQSLPGVSQWELDRQIIGHGWAQAVVKHSLMTV